MTSLLALFALGFSSRQANANPTTYYVATTGSNFNTGLSWSSPKSDLQATIHAAVSGDQVWVEAGTYTDTNNFTPADGVAVYGHFAGNETSIGARPLTNPAYATILEQTGSGTIYTIPSNATGTNTLDGFTIQNGTSGGLYDNTNGTLIVANCMFTSNSGVSLYERTSNATLTNCVFTSNMTNGVGAAIYTFGTNTTIDGCTFTGNSANGYGGAIYAIGTTTTISGCTFTGNSANDYGGAIYASGTTTTISGCTFTGNNAGSYGGAVFAEETTTTISGCKFTSNTAGLGGGVFVDGQNGISTIADCTFGGSSTSDVNTPQAIYLEHVGYRSATPPAPAVIKDNLIIGSGTATTDPDGIDVDTGNSGNTSYATVANNTIVNANVGINIATMSGAISIANNIFYGDYGSVNDTGSPTFTSSHNDNDNNVNYYYQGVNPSSSDLLSVDPKFVMNPSFGATPPVNGDLHLAPASPLINAGDNSYVAMGDTDLDGNPRIQGNAVDIGAYEASPVVAATLTSISPMSATAGSAAFTLTANGTGFVSGATVDWNGAALQTTFVSATQLTATVPASLIATLGTASVTVVNPGVAASNALPFTITMPAATWTATAVSAAPSGISHILWTRSDGAAGLWTLNASGVQTAVGPTYGPYPGWSAKAVAMASDGTSRVLWTNTNGDAGVWTFNAADTETTIGTTYGPYVGWSAKSVGVSGDGTSRVLWTNANGMAGVWSFNAADVETVIGPTYGPYAGWSAQSLATDPSGNSRVLWDNANGTAGVWTFNASDVNTVVGTVYGPYPGWTAKAVGASGDGTARVLWTNTNGMAGIWSFNASDVETVIGKTYGPYAGYSAAALGVASDGTSRVLWDNASRAAGVWSFGPNDVESVIGTVYGPY